MSSENFISLARKWRPRRLSDMVGQEYIVRALQNAAQQNRLHHAFLFTGTRGVGKTTLARIISMLINCENISDNSTEPCLQCETCTLIQRGNMPDIIELDAASHTQVEKMRDLLDNAVYAPVRTRYKIFIIDEVHMLSKSAFNAMLKTLEEPPEHVKFVLATTDPDKVPATIRSRCLCFALLPLTINQISARLISILNAENVNYDQDAIAVIARLANGSLRDGLSILDQALLHCNNQLTANDVRQITGEISLSLLANTLRAVIQENTEKIQQLATQYLSEHVDFDTALANLATLIYKIALAKTIQYSSDNSEESDIIAEFHPQMSADQCQVLYEIAIRGRQQLPMAPTIDTGFEMTLLRMMLFIPQAAAKASLSVINTPNKQQTIASPTIPPTAPPIAPSMAAAVTPVTAASATPNFDWEAVKGGLSEVAKVLAIASIVKHYDANGILLQVDQSHKDIGNKFLPIFKREMQALHGEQFEVTIVYHHSNVAQQEQLENIIKIASDTSFFQSTKKHFPEAKIITDTIKTN